MSESAADGLVLATPVVAASPTSFFAVLENGAPIWHASAARGQQRLRERVDQAAAELAAAMGPRRR